MEIWTKRWNELPPSYSRVLLKHSITEDPVDGRLYSRLWIRQEQGHPTLILEIIQDIHRMLTNQNANDEYIPPTKTELANIWRTLANMHEAMTQSTVYGNTRIQLISWLETRPDANPIAVPQEAIDAAKRYCTYNPKDTKNHDYITQQAIDKSLMEKWTHRLLDLIRPYELPYMTANPEPHQQIRLLGKTKWSTLRGYTNTLEQALKDNPDLLRWNAPDKGNATIHKFLDMCQPAKMKPSKLTKIWSALNWICRKMGYDAPGDQEDLHNSYLQTTTTLDTPLYREPQRAHMPPQKVVCALEDGACDQTQTAVYRYYASALRAHLAVSARYIDMQHTSPGSLHNATEHLHMAPWQTKTTYRGDNILTKYIATKHTYTGHQWWKPLVAQAPKFIQAFRDMDYIYPRMNKTKNKFILQPATSNIVQTMLRHILVTQGVPRDTAHKMTLHGLRLWAAEMAYRTEVPRDLRRYIGQWSEEKTADTYTREHAIIITKIWNHIWQHQPEIQKDTSNLTADTLLPTDPMDEHYLQGANDHDLSAIKIHQARTRTKGKKTPQTKGTPSSDWQIIPAEPDTAPMTEMISPDNQPPGSDVNETDSMPSPTSLAPETADNDSIDELARATEVSLRCEGRDINDDARQGQTTQHPPQPDDPAKHTLHNDETKEAHIFPPSYPHDILNHMWEELQNTDQPEPIENNTLRSTGGETQVTPPLSPMTSSDDDNNTQLPDIDQHPKGPLRVLRGNNKTQGLYRWHYATATNKTIGCNITLRPDKYVAIDTTLDYINLINNSQECTHCGRHSRVPNKWLRACNEASLRPTRPDSDTDETDSDTADTATDPEAEVLDGE